MSAPRVVAEGDDMVIKVQGGFVHRRAPGVGLLFESDADGDTFVGIDDVESLVDAAHALPTRKAARK